MDKNNKKKEFNLEILINKDGKVSFKNINEDAIEIMHNLNPEDESLKKRLELIRQNKEKNR